MTGWDLLYALEGYASLPYQYPLFDTYPVLRIPVAGPYPFNTLVVVRTPVDVMGQYELSDGKIHSWQMTGGTAFTLIGFDPRVKPAFVHSTTAALHMMQQSDDGGFLWAVDEIAGFFDDDGRWTISLKTTAGSDGGWATAWAYVSSWVLCWEPPPSPRPDSAQRSAYQPMSSGRRSQIATDLAYKRRLGIGRMIRRAGRACG